MRIEQLNYLIAIDTYHSMSKSSEKVFVTQQSISSAIKELEEEFGLALVLRTNKGSYLTDAGKELVSAAKEFFTKCNSIQQNFAMKTTGQITLLLEPSSNHLWELIYYYLFSNAPGIQVSRITFSYGELEDVLSANPDAIALTYLHEENYMYYSQLSDYRCTLIKQTPFQLEVSKRSALNQNHSVSINSLHGMRILLLAPENSKSSLYYALKKYNLEAQGNDFIYDTTYNMCNKLMEQPDIVRFSPTNTFDSSGTIIKTKEKLCLYLCALSKNKDLPNELVQLILTQ